VITARKAKVITIQVKTKQCRSTVINQDHAGVEKISKLIKLSFHLLHRRCRGCWIWHIRKTSGERIRNRVVFARAMFYVELIALELSNPPVMLSVCAASSTFAQ
jgi:hypothetical protein